MKTDSENRDFPVAAAPDDLRREIERLREENADLRASALWWKQLYERVMTRSRGSGIASLTGGQDGQRQDSLWSPDGLNG